MTVHCTVRTAFDTASGTTFLTSFTWKLTSTYFIRFRKSYLQPNGDCQFHLKNACLCMKVMGTNFWNGNFTVIMNGEYDLKLSRSRVIKNVNEFAYSANF